MTTVIFRQGVLADSRGVLAMMGRCSRQSLYHRFHGSSDGIAYTNEMMRRLGDIVMLACDGVRCVGVAVTSGGQDGSHHVGLIVEDEFQRRGVGSRLLSALASEAAHRGISVLHADVMFGDEHVIAMTRRLGNTTVRVADGGISVDLVVDTGQPAAQRAVA